MYDTEYYDRYDVDYVELRVGPCIANQQKKCASSRTIDKRLGSHNLRLTMSKFDDLGNTYWEEIAMPKLGESMTLYVRETTVIHETFSDFVNRLIAPSELEVAEKR